MALAFAQAVKLGKRAAIFILLDGAFLLGYAKLALYVVRSRLAPRIKIDKVDGLGALLVIKGYKELP